jgi:hypothetical protein
VASFVDKASDGASLGFNEKSFFAGETEQVAVVEPEVRKGKTGVGSSRKTAVNEEEVKTLPLEKPAQEGSPTNIIELQKRGDAGGSHSKQKAVRNKIRGSNRSTIGAMAEECIWK